MPLSSPPGPWSEEALIPVSALQHFLFCPRQCALIHVERIWAEDGATAEGRLLHQRVDAAAGDRRAGVRIERGMVLRSFALGLSGKADAVEFRGAVPYPVEYKRGRPKAHRADEVQLCAQAMCLEEMFGVAVPCGALFYGKTRRRSEIAFDEALRALVRETADACRAMLDSGQTPKPVAKPACAKCSLVDACLPARLERPPAISLWLRRQLGALATPD